MVLKPRHIVTYWGGWCVRLRGQKWHPRSVLPPKHDLHSHFPPAATMQLTPCVPVRPNKTPPPFARPLPTPCTYDCVGGVYHRASASVRSDQKSLLFFASSCARQYQTVTATSHCGSSARFDRDIGYVIIDVSLLFGGIASSVRGCRPQCVDF